MEGAFCLEREAEECSALGDVPPQLSCLCQALQPGVSVTMALQGCIPALVTVCYRPSLKRTVDVEKQPNTLFL